VYEVTHLHILMQIGHQMGSHQMGSSGVRQWSCEQTFMLSPASPADSLWDD